MKIEALQNNSYPPTAVSVVKPAQKLTSPDANGSVNKDLEKKNKQAELMKALEQQQKKLEADRKRLREQAENSNAQAKSTAEQTDKWIKCLIISQRIMAGDKVPTEDYKFLAENDTELYARAVSLRANNPDPKEHKRLSPSEEEGFVKTVDSPNRSTDDITAHSPAQSEQNKIDVII